MRMRILPACLIVLIAASTAIAANTVGKTTVEDQSNVEVTVYNQNLGLVKDVRTVELAEGEGELLFMDVAAHIKPATVRARSVNAPDAFTVLEQNYEYDLINRNKLLDKYVGKTVKIIDWNKYKDRKETVEATLLSNNQGQIYRIGDEIYLGHPGIPVLPKLPENLIAKPTLTWLYRNSSKEPQKLEVSYLTNNIGWKADYVVALDAEDKKAGISGWVTIDNKSGAEYTNARLRLIAGDVGTVEQPEVFAEAAKLRAPRARMDADRFEEKAFFEYHLYDLQRRTTIKNNQTKQLSLLEANDVSVDKELLVYGVKTWFVRQYRPKQPKLPVSVYVKFKNAKENNLGMPLPAGVMRLYKADSDGALQFIGEDKIEHTPKDEEVKLKIGEAFDVVAERKQTDFRQLATNLYESEWEIKIRNHKDEAVTVGIIEPLFGNWRVVEKSMPYEKLDAFTIKFNVDVPKDGESVVTYRIRVGL